MSKPVDYDELYPGRFLKAVEFKGRKVTLTIADVDIEELESEQGKTMKAILSFRETPKMHVMPKTNGICIKAMFGRVLEDWIGSRVTLFPGDFNGEPAIRVWGSPDIEKDFDVTIKLPRRREFKMTMHAMGKRNPEPEPAPAQTETGPGFMSGDAPNV